MKKTVAELTFMNEHGVKELNVYEVLYNPNKQYTSNIVKLYFERDVVDISPLWINSTVTGEFRKDCVAKLKNYTKLISIPKHYAYARGDIACWAKEIGLKKVILPVKKVNSLCEKFKTLEGFKLKDFDPNEFVVAWQFEQ